MLPIANIKNIDLISNGFFPGESNNYVTERCNKCHTNKIIQNIPLYILSGLVCIGGPQGLYCGCMSFPKHKRLV